VEKTAVAEGEAEGLVELSWVSTHLSSIPMQAPHIVHHRLELETLDTVHDTGHLR
jgi:hypothetical protein